MWSKMLKKIKLQNFMCYKDETIELSSLVTLKGLNGAGKSAMVVALSVFFGKITSSAKIKNYLRKGTLSGSIEIEFTDGVRIQRSIGGVGKYVVEYGGKTREIILEPSGVLPPVIQTYLSVLGDGVNMLNIRRYRDPLLMVETKSSELKVLLDQVLYAKELQIAGDLINRDKNKVGGELKAKEAEKTVYVNMLENTYMSEEFNEGIEQLYACYQGVVRKKELIGEMVEVVDSLRDLPEIKEVGGKYILLHKLLEVLGGIKEVPKLTKVGEKYLLLSEMVEVLNGVSAVYPKLWDIESKKYEMLEELCAIIQNLGVIENEVERVEQEVESLKQEREQYIDSNVGVCPNCGYVGGC